MDKLARPHTLFTGQREKENERKRGRERKWEGEREKQAEFLCLQGCTQPLHQSEREREIKRERERERERCRIWLFLFLKGMTGALAPFSYLVYDNSLKTEHRVT